MASELSKLMKQYGVNSASMALPAQFKGTVVNEPTAPDTPVAPDDFTLKAPVVTDYGLTAGTKAKPTKLAKGQTQADLDAAQKSWTEYQTALDDYTAQKNAYDATKKTYDTYVSGDIKNKDSYAYKQNQYQTALEDYKTYLNNKADFDANKGDIYNQYKTAYQDRIAQTPMYLQQQFTHAPNANPYEGMYSPYGSIENYNKTGTYWNDVIGDPTYTGAYTPYTPLYKQKGFADQASYEATLPTWQQQGYGSELQYLDAKNSNDGLTKVPNTDANTTPSLTDLANKNGVTNTNTSGNTTTGVSTIVGATGNDSLKGVTGNDVITNINNVDTNGYNASQLSTINPWSGQEGATVGTTPAAYGNPWNLSKSAMDTWLAANPNDNYTKGLISSGVYTPTTSVTNTTPTLTDLAVKNGVTNTNTADNTNAAIQRAIQASEAASVATSAAAPQGGINSLGQQVINPGSTQVLDSYGIPIPGRRKFLLEPATTATSNLYAKGGSVHDMARKYAVGGDVDIAAGAMPNPEAGISQPTPAPVAVQAPPSDNMAKMQEMLQAYGTPTNDYAQELEDARRKSNTENEAFMDMFKKARQPENDNLSQAELFFRLAAAAGAPTKTGGITESLSNINKEMADYSKEQTGRRNSDLELQMKAQQLKAAGAKEELGVLRGLAGESMKDKRAIISEMIKAEIPKAQSEAGKLALDMGLKVGTPEYQQFVTNNGMQLLQAKVNQLLMAPSIAAQNANTSSIQAGISGGQLDVARDRYNLSEKEYQDKMSGVIPPVELRKMEKLASKDQQTVENAAKQVNLIKNDITALKTHPGLSGITGMSGNFYKYPGSERAKAQTALESLQNKLEGYGKVAQSASGAIGAMAVAEWDKMRKQIANIDPVKLGEQGTLKALDDLSSDLDASVSMFKSQYEREHDTILERNPDKFQLKLNFGQRVNDEASAKQAGWVLHQDANGNKAYINPANKSEHLEIQ